MADFIQKLIDNIPDYQQFLTVDEMDENSKDVYKRQTLFQTGFSRLSRRPR